MLATLIRVQDMTDLQLDVRLTVIFRQHRNAGPERKANLHRVAVDILDEQAVRRRELLRLS